MGEIMTCPQCGMENCYFDGTMNICPDCGYEWTGEANAEAEEVAKDSNGAILADGDAVTVIKDLKVTHLI